MPQAQPTKIGCINQDLEKKLLICTGSFILWPSRPLAQSTLYRVGEGLSLESHAAKCAAMFGIPTRMVERAEYVR